MRNLELFLPRQNNLQRRFFMGAIMAFRSFLLFLVLGPMVFITGCERQASSAQKNESQGSAWSDLWHVYDRSLKEAKYIDLTHTLTPSIPVWKGFALAKFAPTINPETGQPYTYEKDGFEATHYNLPTDQFGTQLDPRRTGRRSIPPLTSYRRPMPSARWR